MFDLDKEIARRRTFAIISHPDAGKTTLTEKFLLFGGAIVTAGAVKSNKIRKAATSDFMEIEKQRGISVATSVMGFDFKGMRVNILDTPGHKDFAEDTYRTLTAVDSVILVIDSIKGVEEQTEKLIAESRNFLAENKAKEGVVSLASGLQYKIIKNGEGALATNEQSILTHYVGTTIDGKEFDSSRKRDQPFEVTSPRQIIKGWVEILKLMPKGSKWLVYIPADLAYGVQSPSPDIKPYSVLIFEIEIMDIYNQTQGTEKPGK